MKKFFSPIILFVLILISSCSEKFNTAAPYKNITVIYGMLDQKDTAHYIRIQKAFLDENKSALTMAQTADSSFYNNLNVSIKRYDFSNNLWDSIHLNRVDLNMEGYTKQTGTFFNSPNYAYKFKNTLDPNYIYRIVVTNVATGQVDSADAPIINDKDTTLFTLQLFDDSVRNAYGMDFSTTIPGKVFEITGSYTSPSNFSFNNYTSPVGVSQCIIRFNWYDSNSVTKTKTPNYYDYNLGYQALSNGIYIDFKASNKYLYNALSTGMGNAPAHTFRLIDRCDIFIYLGSYDYYTYYQIGLSQGTGLTGNEIEPTYTNIKGQNALGLYTSRGFRSGKITLTPATYDSLLISPIMVNTNLIGKAYP